MIIKSLIRFSTALAASALLALACGPAQAQQVVINDTLTGGHSLYNWMALGGACLTAGDNSLTPSNGTFTPSTATLTIPACSGLAYYTSRGSTLVGGTTGTGVDPSGSGALRLTNGDNTNGSNGNNETGAVISRFTFPMSQGVQITWTSVTYGGNNYNSSNTYVNGTGADGMSFFLSDGTLPMPTTAGGLGGSLGYSCSNINTTYEGLLGGYLGIGMDEYGNFSNPGDNTASGPGFNSGYIVVRGAGDISWSELNRLYPTYYPSSGISSTQQTAAVKLTCSTGKLVTATPGPWYYPNGWQNTVSSTSVNDYKYLTSSQLVGATIANQEAPTSTGKSTRGAATPITYSLQITTAGILNFSYSVNGGATTSVLTGYNITQNNGTPPSALRFGFSAGTGGGSNVHEITCFKAAPAETTNSSAGSNVQSAQVISGTQVYLAYYHPANWWGQLTAYPLAYSSSSDTLITATAKWDASCVLTGGSCTATGGSNTAPTFASRVILSNNGAGGTGTGVAFEVSTNAVPGLTSTQLTALGDTSTSAPRLAYLRGDRSNEQGSGSGLYRVRTGVLGDIVDSSPVWVGYPNSAYTGTWTDKLGTTANATMPEGGTSYAAFEATNATRQNIVYVGANDGMLHGFAAGAFLAPAGTAAPAFDTTANNTGQELIAYVPAQVVATIHSSTASLDYSNPSYVHNFFVDATPGTGDLYYGGAWHTWVVGGLGVGGHPGGAIDDNTQVIAPPVGALYALDVTTPANFKESNAGSLVIGEVNSSTIGCDSRYTITACGIHMGQILGTPLIRRLHDGTWGVIFGNGTNSYGGGTAATAGHSGLFILHIVPADGSMYFQYIDAGPGPHGGIVQVASADLDGDHITDYVYGGDVLGNLYRFDLTNTSSTAWTSMNIFTTASGQPITTAPVVTAIPPTVGSTGIKVLVAFGTGQKLPITVNNAEIYSTGAQALYGIWDANMTAWNGLSSGNQYAALAQTNATTPVAITSSQLTGQTFTTTAATATSVATRTVSNNPVCWAGGSGITGCTNYTQMGWTMALPTSTTGSEQAIYSGTVDNGFFFINTTVPPTSQILTCTTTSVSGWTMGISLANGGSGTTTAFANGTSGVSLNGTGTGAFYTSGTSTFFGTNTNTNNTPQFAAQKINTPAGSGSRVTWTKLR